MTVINTNTSAVIAANSLAKNERAMNEAMERLSTGKRINNAGDDAAAAAHHQPCPSPRRCSRRASRGCMTWTGGAGSGMCNRRRQTVACAASAAGWRRVALLEWRQQRCLLEPWLSY